MVFADESVVRRRRVRKQFLYECEDQPIVDPAQNFRVSFFMVVIDEAAMSLNERFEHLQHFQQTFGFLFDIKQIVHKSDSDLRTACENLEQLLTWQSDGSSTDTNHSDIDGVSLFDELKTLCNALYLTLSPSPVDVLRHMHDSRLNEVLLNVGL